MESNVPLFYLRVLVGSCFPQEGKNMITFSSKRSHVLRFSARPPSVVGIFGRIYPVMDTAFAEAAMRTGELLAREKIKVVYGGGSLGLMGAVATTAHIGGSPVVGIMPSYMSPYCGANLGDLIQVESNSEQISKIYNSVNAFIVLPGGQDILEGLSCVLSWSFINAHAKPIFLLNINGYFTGLLAFLDNAVRNGFMYSTARITVLSATTVDDLIRKLLDFNFYPGPSILQLPVAGKRKRESDHDELDLTLSL